MINHRKYASLLLLLHQPYRVTDSTQFKVNTIEDLFEGQYNKAGYISSNKDIFEKIAQNCYIPAGNFWLRYLEKHPDFKVNFTFSGVFLEQCLQYSNYGSEVLTIFKKLVATGRVGIAGENYYHGITHYYSWEEFARQIQEQRQLIKELFGVWPTYFRNTENKGNNEIAEFVRLMGFDTMGFPGLYRFLDNQEQPTLKSIERPLFYREHVEAAINHNDNETTPRYMTIAPLDHKLSDTIFNLKELTSEESILKENIKSSNWGFHLLFNDFEALGEHNSNTDGVYEAMEKFIELFTEEGITFLSIGDLSNHANFEEKKYNIPFSVSSGNAKQDLESWRGNYLQEKAFVALTYLHDEASKLYDDQSKEAKRLLDAYRKLTTSDHFYYLADIPGPVGEVHKMFSPYNNTKDAFESYMFAINFVRDKITEYLNSNA